MYNDSEGLDTRPVDDIQHNDGLNIIEVHGPPDPGRRTHAAGPGTELSIPVVAASGVKTAQWNPIQHCTDRG